ncbi:SNF2/RAD54 helicase family protein [Abortiporus biennis]
MVRTRRSTRDAPQSSSATPTTATTSPMFSPDPPSLDTPMSSDIDEEDVKPSRKTRASALASSRTKRVDPSDVPLSNGSNPRKRKHISEKAFVEIKTKKPAREESVAKPSTRRVHPSTVVETAPEAIDDVLVEDDELEYDENASIHEEEEEESEDSGSEFQASDDDFGSIVEDSQGEQELQIPMGDDEDVEEAMMATAIQLSLRAARLQGDSLNGLSNSGAGPSKVSSSTRRTRRGQVQVPNAEEYVPDSEGEIEPSASESEEDVPIARKSKGKSKSTSKAKSKTVASNKTAKKSAAQIRREKRQEKLQEKKNTRAEEQALRKKLGRKLTTAEKATIQLHKHHPELIDVWGDLERGVTIAIPQRGTPPPNLKVTLLPFQLESLHWMKVQETGIWSGGLLADEMGMGKTIQMIALLCSDAGAKPNLVVAPTVAIMQWRNEIEAHSDGLDVLVWHGASRATDMKTLNKYDVVLTTYAVLESCFRKQHSGFKRKGMIVKEKSVMHQIEWNRVILDEAHNIKERSTNTAKATFELKAKYRWCLSGTPLQNRVGELYSMVRFLGGDPFSYYFCKKCDCKSLHWKFSDKRTCDDCGHSPMVHTCFWNNEILTPIQKNGMVGPGAIAFKKLKILLDRMMLRRTKIQRADDLGLPPRTVIVRRDYFSPEEKELYTSLFSDAKRQFTTYVDSGTILNNYSNIFSLLTRMRQMACHPDLVLKSKTNASKFMNEDIGEATLCRLCNDIAEDAIQAQCRHIFDRECIKQYLTTAIEITPACPVCHVPLTIDLEAPALDLEENVKTRQGILGRLDLDRWRSSSKIEALIEELSNLRRQDATTKSLVFSQFVNFLDLIAFRLQKAGFSICRLEGTMSPQARDATIKHFMNNVHVTVFLVSLKAGGVALNLTEASRVYLMDSWWNPAVEYQAMDRIHRLGQHRPVQAIKLVIEDSIESRIIQLQEKKSAMVDATLSADDSAMGRLTPEDLGFLFRL